MKKSAITSSLFLGLFFLAGCVTNPSSSQSNTPGAKPAAGQASAAKSDEKKTDGGGVSGALSGIGSLAGAIGGSSSGSGAGSTDNKVGAALDLAKAASVTDDEIKASSLQFRKWEEKQVKIAPTSNKYAQRLNRLTRKHANEDGLKLNFKVILSNNVNANASADGSIRFYSAIMDMLTDQELLAVLGHEIGHVKFGHTLSKTRTALLASATRKAAASSSGKAGILADSELGGFGERLFNSQFSQSAEYEADDYALAFMRKHKYDPKALESVFRKLAGLSGKKDAVSQMLSTHPDAAARADRIRDLLAKK
jgi:metalloprotease